MPPLSRDERIALGQKRLLRVLARHGIANWRTLEQKISDAGPGHQRVDPHILTVAKRDLEEKGQIVRRMEANTAWFFLPEATADFTEARLAVQLPVYSTLQTDNFRKRLGQSLEIAVYRALLDQRALPDHLGAYLDLADHGDSDLYSKEEPPRRLGARDIVGDRRLDFLVRHSEAGWAGIEVKNIREWMYPRRSEVTEMLSKCVALDVVPVLIARRVHFSTFLLLNTCGGVVHQTYNQLFPTSEAATAASASHKDNLGYHDIRARNTPDNRLLKFINTDLPDVLPERRATFDYYKDLITEYTSGNMRYHEFAARIRRRRCGTNEDHDWPDEDERDEEY